MNACFTTNHNIMTTLLQQQYTLIQSSREVVFNFIEHEAGNDLNKPVAAFDNKTMRYLLVHTANTYLHWLSYFAHKQEVNFVNDENFTTIALIKSLYEKADQAVENFLFAFADNLNLKIAGTLSHNRQVTATPLQLFTHVTTHEFHHKGQVMTMARLLGHPPPDTDIIRT